jgi:hypothetical protein
MTVRQLHNLLRGRDGTRGVVVSGPARSDLLEQVWRAAQDEADKLYDNWHEHGGREAYLAYRAAADRADAALDAVIDSGRDSGCAA